MVWQLINVTKGSRNDTALARPVSSVRYTHSAYGDISRLSFTFDDETGMVPIDDDDEYYFTDDGVKVFAGYVRQIRRTDRGLSSQRTYELALQDYTVLLSDDVVDNTTVLAGSDKSMITTLFSTYGTKGVVVGAAVQQLRTLMPAAIDFTDLTLHQCLTEIAKVTGGSFYVDFDKVLRYFDSDILSAPWGLSDNPNDSTTFGYEEFELPSDSSGYKNAVRVVGEGVALWRTRGGVPVSSLRASGTLRAAVLRDTEITTVEAAEARGDSFLATAGDVRQPGSLIVYKPGLRGGMNVNITHAGWGLSGTTYRITAIEAQCISSTRTQYRVRFGGAPINLNDLFRAPGDAISDLSRSVKDPTTAVTTAIADLSVGGGNLLPNASFENVGVFWGIDSGWSFPLDPVPDKPFHGTRVARWNGSTVGNTLNVPLASRIAIARSDHYWVSLWRFIRTMPAGCAMRLDVRQYSSAGAQLAQTLIDSPTGVVDTEWTRMPLHFAPAAGPGIDVVWHASAASVRILVWGKAFGTGTTVVDIDAAQIERGKLLTAFTPSAYELRDASVGTTQITDNAVIAQKIGANQVVAGKVAADAIGTNELQANSVTANELAAGSVRAQHMLIAGGRSPLIDNPDFEAGSLEVSGLVEGWQVNQPTGALVRITDDQHRNGARSAQITNGASGIANIRSSTFPVLPNEKLAISFWHIGAGVCRAWLWVQSATGGVTVIGPFVDLSAGGAWVRRSFAWTTLSTSVRAAVLIENLTPSSNLFVDDVQPSRTMDMVSANGDVLANPAGLTILNGKIVVQNPSGTVVIDGTSNMLKIILSGSVTVPGFTGPGQGEAIVTYFTGVPYRPAHLAYYLDEAGVPETLLLPVTYFNESNGLVTRSHWVTVILGDNPNETKVRSLTRSRLDIDAQDYRYMIFKEEAI